MYAYVMSAHMCSCMCVRVCMHMRVLTLEVCTLLLPSRSLSFLRVSSLSVSVHPSRLVISYRSYTRVYPSKGGSSFGFVN